MPCWLDGPGSPGVFNIRLKWSFRPAGIFLFTRVSRLMSRGIFFPLTTVWKRANMRPGISKFPSCCQGRGHTQLRIALMYSIRLDRLISSRHRCFPWVFGMHAHLANNGGSNWSKDGHQSTTTNLRYSGFSEFPSVWNRAVYALCRWVPAIATIVRALTLHEALSEPHFHLGA